jgi:hypothetical protein
MTATPRVPRAAKIAHEDTEHSFISRKRALSLGLVKFFDPSDTARCGHVSQRWAISGMCVRCAQEYHARSEASAPKRKHVSA